MPPAPPVVRTRGWQRAVGVTLAAVAFAYLGLGGMGGILAIVKEWTRADYSHGFLVVPFAGYLLWHRRAMLPARFAWPDYYGLPLAVLPLVGYFWAGVTNYAREWIQGACLVLTLAGVAVMFCGRWAGLRWAWPALAMLVLTLPLPNAVEWSVSWQLRKVATAAAVGVFRTLGFATHMPSPVVIHVDQAKLQVAEACSGLSMLMMFIALTACIVFLCPPTRPRVDRWVVFLSAIPIAVLCNILRIVVSGLVLVAGWKKAFDFFVHEYAGLLMPVPALVLVWGLFKLIDWLYVPVKVMSREEVVRAGLAEARQEIARQEEERKAMLAAVAARGGRPAEPRADSGAHPAAPFLSLTPDGTAHGATAAGGTLPPPADPPKGAE